MKSFTVVHDIQCDADAFWKVFFDKAYNEAFFRDFLQFPHYEVLEQRETDGEIYRKVKVVPKMDAPGPVVKALGSSFSYVEEGTLDRKTGLFRWTSHPSSLADKVATNGTIKVEPAGEGKVRRVSEFNYEARVFGIGGLLESVLEKNLRHSWDKSAEFTNRWVREKKA